MEAPFLGTPQPFPSTDTPNSISLFEHIVPVQSAHLSPSNRTLAHAPPHSTHLPASPATISLTSLNGLSHVPSSSAELLDAPTKSFVGILTLTKARDSLIAQFQDLERQRGRSEESIRRCGRVKQRSLSDGRYVRKIEIMDGRRGPRLPWCLHITLLMDRRRLEESVYISKRELGSSETQFLDMAGKGEEVRNMTVDNLSAVEIEGTKRSGKSREDAVDVGLIEKAIADNVTGEVEVDEAVHSRVSGKKLRNTLACDVGTAAKIEVSQMG